MSGHSKWSKVKHQKEATDAIKGKIFTKLSSAIIIAVKEGGGTDSDSNFKLRLAIDKAKSLNMPKENIQRAIEKAEKKEGGEDLNEVLYEAFGPSGVCLLIKAVTDNRQRTVSELKNTLEKGGGVLAASGAVSHFFKSVGFIEVSKNAFTAESVFEKAVNAGAEDIEEMPESVFIYTAPMDLHKVGESLRKEGLKIITSELYFRPFEVLSVTYEDGEKIKKFIEIIEQREDVLRVFSNIKIEKNV